MNDINDKLFGHNYINKMRDIEKRRETDGEKSKKEIEREKIKRHIER